MEITDEELKWNAPPDECHEKSCFQDVAGVGYIPIASEGPSQDWRRRPRVADLLFRSGNYEPPALSGKAHLIRYLASRKDYRGAILISNLEVGFDKNAKPQGARVTVLSDILACGYTPIQSISYSPASFDSPPPGSQQWRYKRFHQGKGITRGDPDRLSFEVLENGDLEITHWQTFRLGPFANVGAKLLTGAGAPFAWLQVTYVVSGPQTARASMCGSSIPSVQIYAGKADQWVSTQKRCLCGNTAQDIDGFLNAGPNQLAPPAWLRQIP